MFEEERFGFIRGDAAICHAINHHVRRLDTIIQAQIRSQIDLIGQLMLINERLKDLESLCATSDMTRTTNAAFYAYHRLDLQRFRFNSALCGRLDRVFKELVDLIGGDAAVDCLSDLHVGAGLAFLETECRPKVDLAGQT